MRKNEIDIQEALINPASAFSHPGDVLHHPELDSETRQKILERWKLDAENLAVASQESMSGGEENMLHEVMEALKSVREV